MPPTESPRCVSGIALLHHVSGYLRRSARWHQTDAISRGRWPEASTQCLGPVAPLSHAQPTRMCAGTWRASSRVLHQLLPIFQISGFDAHYGHSAGPLPRSHLCRPARPLRAGGGWTGMPGAGHRRGGKNRVPSRISANRPTYGPSPKDLSVGPWLPAQAGTSNGPFWTDQINDPRPHCV